MERQQRQPYEPISNYHPDWLKRVIEVFGEPSVWPKNGKNGTQLETDLGAPFWRLAWVWFPGGINHHIHIDRYYWDMGRRVRYDTCIGSHHNWMPRVASFVTVGPPTDGQMEKLFRLTTFFAGAQT